MEWTAGAGISGRQERCPAPQNAPDAAAVHATSVKREGFLQRLGLEGSAHDANGASVGSVGEHTTAPPTPPDEPGAMTEQTLEPWSLSDLIGVPGLGRLLSAVQRAAG